MIKAGVIDSTKFIVANSSGFKSYLDYMGRSEAVRTKSYSIYNVAFDDLKKQDFDAYNEYMSNPEKTSALFNDKSDNLDNQQINSIKDLFKKAQDNKSIMWQHVVSFDNKWLEKFGQYDPVTHELNEETVMMGARNAMRELMKAEGMEGAVWTGAIHYNTDNIHVHIAMVEPNPTREKYYPLDKDGNRIFDKKTNDYVWQYRGKLKPKSLGKIKSAVASSIADQSQMLANINTLSRENIASREQFFNAVNIDNSLLKQYNSIIKQLPKNMSLWKYNNNALSELRPQIDKMIDEYISKYHSSEFDELNQELDKAVDFYKETYGQSRYDDFKLNKIKDMKASLGNGLLKDMKIYRKQELALQKISSKYPNFSKIGYSRLPSLNHLNDAFEKSYNEILNERDYERLKAEIEYEANNDFEY